MKSDLYDAIREATEDEFDLLADLGGGDEWSVFLGRARDGNGLALLLLQEAEDGGGQFDLEVIEAVEAGLPAGRTTCAACGAGEAGWPRFCAGCGADLSGVAAPAGASAAELLEAVCGAVEGEYRVLGALPRAEGGGALYFAREEGTDRVVGLALQQEPGGELDLVVAWTPQTEATPPRSAESERVVSADPLPPRPPFEPEPESNPVPPLWDPPSGRSRARSRDRARRAGATAAIAVVAVALVAAVVWAVTGTKGESGAKAMGPGPGVEAATSALSPAPAVTSPAESAAAPGGDVATSAGLPHRDPPGPVRAQPAKSATQPATPSVAVVTPPAEEPEPEPVVPTAPSADGVEAAVRQYAQAVGSCQTSRISRAYPGITGAEMDRWERVFRDRCGGGLRTVFAAESPPAVNGTRAEQVFTLTLVSTGATGSEVRQPLLLRAVLEWRGGAWSLREVRTLGAR
ncbi:MAG TPA: hypothetical protein VHG51_12385 [Longimicrobiaceae bacterium]|nr:hypothetical protein [Longimicrobiaceae bacterium]